MVTRPLAHPPASSRSRMIRAAILTVALAALPAEALDVGVPAYREAAQSGAVGTVAGRAYAESRTPAGPPQPLTGTIVTLMPRSQALLLSLERLKEDARRSSSTFVAAAPAMRRRQEAYERELLEAGAPDLAPRLAVGADGAFRVPDVPAGAWLVVAWHSVPFDVSAAKSKGRDRQLYQLGPRMTGYQAVTIWLRELTVVPGETVSAELTDRNAWFRGVIEEKTLDAGR
jgi:hypothetical protein